MSRKKNVIILIENISLVGGTERAVFALSKILTQNSFSVKIVSVDSENNNPVYSMPDGVEVIHLGIKKRLIKKYSLLKKTIDKINQDIGIDYLISSGHNFSCFLLPFFYKKIKCVACEHLNREMLSFPIKILQSMIYNKLWRVIVLTPAEKKSYSFLKENIFVIPNSIENFDVLRTNIQNIILAVGRLEKVKGFDLLIDAINLKKDYFKDYQVRICGNGSEKDNLQRKINENGLNEIVKLIPVHDLKEDYLSSKVFILSSRCESFGLSLLEAMQYKIPCIAFKSTGPNYILQDDAMILIDQDKVLLSERIQDVCNNQDLQNNIINRQNECLKKFSIDTVSKLWLKNVFC